MSDLNQNWSGSTNFRKVLKYHFPRKSVPPFSSCYTRTDRK